MDLPWLGGDSEVLVATLICGEAVGSSCDSVVPAKVDVAAAKAGGNPYTKLITTSLGSLFRITLSPA
jgi:hypothetical protein